MTASRVDVAALEAALEKATPGEWSILLDDYQVPQICTTEYQVAADVALGDAELIVLMRSTAPALVALVRAVEALADDLAAAAQGRADNYWDSGYDAALVHVARHLRSAVGAALNPQETER